MWSPIRITNIFFPYLDGLEVVVAKVQGDELELAGEGQLREEV